LWKCGRCKFGTSKQGTGLINYSFTIIFLKMKKTILFAFALCAMLLTTVLSAQTTRPGSGAGAGTGTGAGSGSSTVGGSQGGSTVGGSQGGSKAAGGGSGTQAPTAITYPKVFVLTSGQARRMLAGNLFKGKDQKVDLTFDIVDSKGNVIKDDAAAITKGADGDYVIDASKFKSKTGNRLRVKGAGTNVEFYPIN
jgi:hypothetical protein